MDIKELNRTQLILLALLLSFVTSIATGITTVTLMQQAPDSVTVPINRIVKQTVEKIQQVEGKTTVQTVVVKEEDLVVDAISKNQPSAVSITHEVVNSESNVVEVSVGRGFTVSKEGIIVADAALIPESGKYYVKNASGKFRAEFVSTDKAGFSLLRIAGPADVKDTKTTLTAAVPTFGDISKMKPGQKIIMFGANISSFIFEGNKDLKLNVSKVNGGSMVLNLDGEVLGIALSSADSSFVPSDAIMNALKAPAKSL